MRSKIMFTILGENPIFHQWDTDQKLIVEDSSVTEVHFSNGTTDCALVCEVYEQDGLKLVNVPNILLQKSLTILAYAYCTNYTKQSVAFKVVARSKPDSYVYTETETKTYEAIEEKIGAIDTALDTIIAIQENLIGGDVK